MADTRFIVFDVETPNRYNNRMSAIGISVVEKGRIVHSFFSYVNPETFFDNFNTMLTGIDERTVASAPAFPELWKTIEPMLSSGILVAHNALFDLGVLKKCLTDYGIAWKPSADYCCTVQIGRRLLCYKQHRKIIAETVENANSPNHTMIMGLFDGVRRVRLTNVNICIISGIHIGLKGALRGSGLYAEELQELMSLIEKQGNTFSSIAITNGSAEIKKIIQMG